MLLGPLLALVPSKPSARSSTNNIRVQAIASASAAMALQKQEQRKEETHIKTCLSIIYFLASFLVEDSLELSNRKGAGLKKSSKWTSVTGQCI